LSIGISMALGVGLLAPLSGASLTPANAASITTPTGLKAAAVSANAIAVTWRSVKGAPAYRVQFSTHSNMSGAKTMDLAQNYLEWNYLNPEPSAKSGRLKANTKYYFRVKVIAAVDLSHSAKSLSSYSKKVTIRTAKTSSHPYLAPAKLTSTGQSSSSMYLSWTSRGPGVHYRMQYGTSPTLTDAHTKVFRYSGGVLDGLRAATTYYYRVVTISGDERSALSPYSALASLTTPSTSGSPAIRLATNNICSYACGNWDARRAIIAASLSYQDPDLIALQEASRDEDLVADLNAANAGRNYQLFAYSSHADLAYDANRFSLNEGAWGELTFTAENDPDKNAVWAIFTDKLSGKRLFVVSVHLTNSDSTNAQRVRPLEAQDVVNLVKANNPDKLPVVIAGDFNTSKRKADHPAVYDTMTTAGYLDPLGNTSDSRYVAKAATAEHRIDVGYASANQYQSYALRSKWLNGYNVDYIWQSSGIRMAMFQTVIDLDATGRFVGTIATDHNMLVATFHLN